MTSSGWASKANPVPKLKKLVLEAAQRNAAINALKSDPVTKNHPPAISSGALNDPGMGARSARAAPLRLEGVRTRADATQAETTLDKEEKSSGRPLSGVERKFTGIPGLKARSARGGDAGKLSGAAEVVGSKVNRAGRAGGAPAIDLVLTDPTRLTVTRKAPTAVPAPNKEPPEPALAEKSVSDPVGSNGEDEFEVLQWVDLKEPEESSLSGADESVPEAEPVPPSHASSTEEREAPSRPERRTDAPCCFETALARNLVAMDQLNSSQMQPRMQFDEENIRALAAKIEANGLPQLILVRPHPDLSGQYEVVAGEFLYRAAQLAGLKELPVVVGNLSDREVLECALLENLQRQDLTLLETAEGYNRLITAFNYSWDDVAKAVGKSPTHVADRLRLLNLPPVVKDMLRRGELNAVQARVLAAHAGSSAGEPIPTRMQLPRGEGDAGSRVTTDAAATGGAATLAAEFGALERNLRDVLGLEVAVNARGQQGALSISFSNLEQLERIVRHLSAFGEQAKTGKAWSGLAA